MISVNARKFFHYCCNLSAIFELKRNRLCNKSIINVSVLEYKDIKSKPKQPGIYKNDYRWDSNPCPQRTHEPQQTPCMALILAVCERRPVVGARKHCFSSSGTMFALASCRNFSSSSILQITCLVVGNFFWGNLLMHLNTSPLCNVLITLRDCGMISIPRR